MINIKEYIQSLKKDSEEFKIIKGRIVSTIEELASDELDIIRNFLSDFQKGALDGMMFHTLRIGALKLILNTKVKDPEDLVDLLFDKIGKKKDEKKIQKQNKEVLKLLEKMTKRMRKES